MSWIRAEQLFHKAFPDKFLRWTKLQDDAYQQWQKLLLQRALLFFPTGKGKSKTGLGLLFARGYRKVVVIAPPGTHEDWKADAQALGMEIRLDSHEKFRRQATLYTKTDPIIVDEFHKLGGHDKMGWKKLNRMATKLDAPIIMMSATPNYNDAERVFCITAIGDAKPNRNYLNWIYENCRTEPNYFSTIPKVTGFLHHENAVEFLKSRPYTMWVEDTAEWTAEEVKMPLVDLTVFERYNYYERSHRVMASDMEKRHKRVDVLLIDDEGLIRLPIMRKIWWTLNNRSNRKKWLFFCAHETVAKALQASIEQGIGGYTKQSWLITGSTNLEDRKKFRDGFIDAEEGILIGTTALATGVDKIDKVCQSMFILDDIVGDDALRRQLIGRILPRGGDDEIERVVVTATY